MPISKEEFEKRSEITTKTSKVLDFLKTNSEEAYTSAEITENVSIEYSTVSTLLHQLRKAGKIIHKSPYWMVKE